MGITIKIEESEKRKDVEFKKNPKREEHFKKYSKKCGEEAKGFIMNSYGALKNMVFMLMYGLAVVGDVILIYVSSKKKSIKKEKKKSILDEGI